MLRAAPAPVAASAAPAPAPAGRVPGAIGRVAVRTRRAERLFVQPYPRPEGWRRRALATSETCEEPG